MLSKLQPLGRRNLFLFSRVTGIKLVPSYLSPLSHPTLPFILPRRSFCGVQNPAEPSSPSDPNRASTEPTPAASSSATTPDATSVEASAAAPDAAAPNTAADATSPDAGTQAPVVDNDVRPVEQEPEQPESVSATISSEEGATPVDTTTEDGDATQVTDDAASTAARRFRRRARAAAAAKVLSYSAKRAEEGEGEAGKPEAAEAEQSIYTEQELNLKDLYPLKELGVTFEEFPYYLNPVTKEVILHTTYAHFFKQRLASPSSLSLMRCPGFMLEGPKGTEFYQENLVKATAHHLGANLLIISQSYQVISPTLILQAIKKRGGSDKTIVYLVDAINNNYADQLSLLTVHQDPNHPIAVIGSSISQKEKSTKQAAQQPQIPVDIKEALRYMKDLFATDVKVEAKKSDATPENDTKKYFSTTVQILPPTDPEELATWQKKIQFDVERHNVKSNMALLSQVLQKNKITYDGPIKEGLIKNGPLNKKQVEDVVRWAISNKELAANPPLVEKYGDSDLITVGGQNISYGFDLLRKTQELAHQAVIEEKFKHADIDDPFEKKLLSNVVIPEQIDVTFDNIGSLDTTKDTLRELVTAPLIYPFLFNKGILSKGVGGILLFGPPGTGKTMLAKALAKESRATFMNISMASITSKWYGDSEKHVHALFSLARKLSPCVLFLDEIDSFLCRRGEDHEATRRVKNDFMALWDGLKSGDPRHRRILVMGATNRPFDLDEAALRRLPKRILIDIPSKQDRAAILRVMLQDESLSDDVNLDQLAEMTDGYSGSDLKHLCVAACYQVVRHHLKAMKGFSPVMMTEDGTEVDVPIPHEYKNLRALTMEDFRKAKDEIQSSVSEQSSSVRELRKWNQQYGMQNTKDPQGVIGF